MGYLVYAFYSITYRYISTITLGYKKYSQFSVITNRFDLQIFSSKQITSYTTQLGQPHVFHGLGQITMDHLILSDIQYNELCECKTIDVNSIAIW